ncbi:MAG TPA: hypothetical protein VFO85_17040, partial [Vicinamibacteria bacterium]|nr:hypothetical protein [Vicinamibacteria bacterium]
HHSFFYLLTGLHVVHLLGALVWFLAVLSKARRMAYTPGLDGLGLFAIGQVAAWRWLAARGFYLESNPHNSFFYVLTGTHLVHLAGGLVWCGVALSRVRRLAAAGHDGLGLFATYWHFLAGLWIYLLLLLFVF